MLSIAIFTTLSFVTSSLAQAVPDAAHKYIKAAPGQSRSPCPALNTLANHGYIPRDGKGVTRQHFIDGLNTVFNFDKKFVAKLSEQAFTGLFPVPAILRPQSMQLHDLAKQGVIVHNASLTRPDMGPGYSPAVVPAMVDALLADSTNDWIYPRTLLVTRERRERESKRSTARGTTTPRMTPTCASGPSCPRRRCARG